MMVITIFYPKPGKLDEFLETQIAGLRQLVGETPPPGWLGNRLCRSRDGQAVVMVAKFESFEAQQQFVQRRDLAEHVERVKPLIERREIHFCDLAYEAGGL